MLCEPGRDPPSYATLVRLSCAAPEETLIMGAEYATQVAMPTLKEIAADLGVSHTLVSVVASGRMGTTRISEATRKMIQTRLDEVDFRPNRLALALKGGHKGYVGVFLHKHGTFGSELNEAFISTVSDSLAERGLGLWLRIFTSDREFLDACSQRLLREVDGLVVAGISHPELIGNLKLLRDKGLPVVCAFVNPKKSQSIPNVSVDAKEQGRLAARHLVESGCRRIARLHCHEERQQGFLKGLREAGRKPLSRLMIPAADFGYDAGLRAMRSLLASGESFDGLSADSDALACAAVHYSLRMGRPRDAWPKIVGIDDSPIAQHCAVPLTSVTSEIAERARHVVTLLFDLFDGKKVASVEVTPRIVVRESTEPALASEDFPKLG